MTDREKHIKNLSYIMDSMPDDACGEWRDSLAYAISSLKTDLKYDLMYEGEDIYTKADMVAMLEDLDLQIEESAAYNLEVAKVQRLIRDRIDKLSEDK